ncbi:hypothetical protein Tco_1214792 [Tanacetum coccineum]
MINSRYGVYTTHLYAVCTAGHQIKTRYAVSGHSIRRIHLSTVKDMHLMQSTVKDLRASVDGRLLGTGPIFPSDNILDVVSRMRREVIVTCVMIKMIGKNLIMIGMCRCSDHHNNDQALGGDDDYILFSTDGLPGPEHGVNVNANSLHHGVLDTNVARNDAFFDIRQIRFIEEPTDLSEATYCSKQAMRILPDNGFIVVEFPVILAAVNKNEKQQLERTLNACKGIPQVSRV